MNTIYTNKLTENELNQAKELIKICQNHDGTFKEPYLSNMLNFDKSMPAFFMAYNENILVGILTVYADSYNIEVSINIHPKFRMNGIAKALYNLFLEKTKDYGISSIEFISERKFLDKNQDLLKHWNIKETNDTESWLHKGSIPYEIDKISELSISIANENDIDKIAKINAEAFDSPLNRSLAYAKESMNDKNSILYVIKKKDIILGSCTVDISSNSNYLYGLAISKEYRGQGIGSYFVKNIVNELISKNNKDFQIAVDDTNIGAKKLYENLGFEYITQVVYLS
ncbi:GNAT family N-acetyltransferase [Helcococcus ovis]|uniref:GNAT family N-acetyltransferase n=1 Tax=Helcococcus ovis TaxID=72026 RepID=UPI00106F2BD9|nr:GNAT family N-acetyltransferase [Helcococcus ovis]TFF68798.1 GNAT family N-acetyltransferase [Helcococcus ovis]WNZ01182.1 GNAT family N-acetyltransferase [Helcococcus ovis]